MRRSNAFVMMMSNLYDLRYSVYFLGAKLPGSLTQRKKTEYFRALRCGINIPKALERRMFGLKIFGTFHFWAALVAM